MKTAKVADLGRSGDGIIKENGKAVFIENTLPDEIVSYEENGDGRGRVVEIKTASPDRRDPECAAFENCGGCALRHMAVPAYRDFKLRMLRDVLKDISDLPDFDPPAFIDANCRRRVTFAVGWAGFSRFFGLNERRSDKIMPVVSCPALVDGLSELIPALRKLVDDKRFCFPKKKGVGDISVLQSDTGADVVMTLPFDPDLQTRTALSDFAYENGVARISWRRDERESAEPLVTLRAPELAVGDFILKPPAGCFLQPSAQGQDALTAAVSDYAGKAKKVLDLFCGAGTFALTLLRKKRVVKGVDNASDSLAALRAASQGRIEVEDRDLFKTPYFSDELRDFDAVVFDPPRAGAKMQAAEIAQSDVPRVIGVSCNPVTFARDAATLIDGGYRLTRLRPVDQFVFTPHIELTALFEKK